MKTDMDNKKLGMILIWVGICIMLLPLIAFQSYSVVSMGIGDAQATISGISSTGASLIGIGFITMASGIFL